MAIRFTEFINHHDHQVNLYIMQENEESGKLCFKVHVKDGDQGQLFLCKNEGTTWKISPQDSPGWLNELKPLVISAIEKRITNESQYFSRPGFK